MFVLKRLAMSSACAGMMLAYGLAIVAGLIVAVALLTGLWVGVLDMAIGEGTIPDWLQFTLIFGMWGVLLLVVGWFATAEAAKPKPEFDGDLAFDEASF